MMAESSPSPCTLVIFGASGDLTQRKLIPALHSLDCAGLLPPGVCVLGVARTEYTDDQFRERLRQGVKQYGRLGPEVWGEFSNRLHYLPGSYDDPETYHRIKNLLQQMAQTENAPGNWLFYLAIPPVVYSDVIEQLGRAGMNRGDSGWRRIIIEKPFGHDLESACHINRVLHQFFDESQVFRIDHFLGKETVQNLLALRFANFLFEDVWDRKHIDYVQIAAMESVGVGQRAGYYDQNGVVRDMLQNHMLQLLALTAMEPPAEMNAKVLRDEKVKVLQAVQPILPESVVFGQYAGYRDEPEVEPASDTPTYVAAKLFVNNWRWQGVPFFLRTGKNLKIKLTEIILQFKQVPHWIFPENDQMLSNRLSICIQPDEGLHLLFELKVPGAEMHTSPVEMDFHYDELLGDQALPDAYERLLLDALQGDASLFTRSDEIERAWELVDPLLEARQGENKPALYIYEPDSWGPVEADQWGEREGCTWVVSCNHEVKKPSF